MEDCMIKLLVKYKWFIVAGLVFMILAPIIINKILLMPIITDIVGDNTDWLSFWGGYLGAIISFAIAFIVLFVQREDNQKENEQNRQLQLNIISYQQQRQWLESLSKAMIDNIMIYSPNYLSDIINLMYQKQGFKLIHDHIKHLLNQLILTDTTVGFLMPENQSEALRGYNQLRKECYTKYTQIIMKIEIIAIKHCSLIEKRDYLINQNTTPEDSETFLKELNSINTEKGLFEKAESLKDSFEDTFERIRTSAINCINEEKKSIEFIIKEEDGTR